MHADLASNSEEKNNTSNEPSANRKKISHDFASSTELLDNSIRTSRPRPQPRVAIDNEKEYGIEIATDAKETFTHYLEDSNGVPKSRGPRKRFTTQCIPPP